MTDEARLVPTVDDLPAGLESQYPCRIADQQFGKGGVADAVRFEQGDEVGEDVAVAVTAAAQPVGTAGGIPA